MLPALDALPLGVSYSGESLKQMFKVSFERININFFRHGANPDLRDEDGKTPLDKARERNDEGHREVASLLQSPGDWVGVGAGEEAPPRSQQEGGEVRGDPEMIPVYVHTLLPVFCHTFQSTMIPSVKRASLGLVRKMLHYLDPVTLEEVSTKEFGHQLVAVLATVLDTEEDEEGQLVTLSVIQDLMGKAGAGESKWLEHFAKLGVYSKVHMLCEPQEGEPLEVDLGEGYIQEEGGSGASGGEVTEIVAGRAYHWKDWCLARGRDCLYIWSDAAALELSNGSNGWFRFILDNKLATMYSSGSPEGGSDSSKNRGEFLEKLQRARASVSGEAPAQSCSRVEVVRQLSLLATGPLVACQLVGGRRKRMQDGSLKRGDIHNLLMGHLGSSTSKALTWIQCKLGKQLAWNMFGKRKTWDDNCILKCKFSALIPAFDHCPGRTNTPTDFGPGGAPSPSAPQ